MTRKQKQRILKKRRHYKSPQDREKKVLNFCSRVISKLDPRGVLPLKFGLDTYSWSSPCCEFDTTSSQTTMKLS